MASQTFKTGKIRKNASKKIAALLEMATSIQFSKYYNDYYSDCWVYADDVEASVEFTKEWMTKNYSDQRVFLVCDENNQPKEMTISAFGGYFTITFAPVEVEEPAAEKPRFTYQQVRKAIDLYNFVSPLNSDEKKVEEVQEEPEQIKVQRTSKIGKYLETLIEEKGRDTEEEIALSGHFGLTYEILIDYIETAGEEVQNKIRHTCTQIDFKNGDVFHYLKFLAKGMADSVAFH